MFSVPLSLAYEANIHNVDSGRARILRDGISECRVDMVSNQIIVTDAECAKRNIDNYDEDIPHDKLNIDLVIEFYNEDNLTSWLYHVSDIYIYDEIAILQREAVPYKTEAYTPYNPNLGRLPGPEMTPRKDPATLEPINFHSLERSPDSERLEEYFDSIPKLNDSYNFVVKILQGEQHICDGSVIAKDVILSATRCIQSLDLIEYKYQNPHYAILDLKVELAYDGGSMYEISKMVHRDHIMLLKLKTPLPETVEIVKLYDRDMEKEGLIFKNSTLLTRGVLGRFSKLDEDHFESITPIVEILNIPKRYCPKAIITDSSYICAKQTLPELGIRYCPTHLGGPIIFGEWQVGIVTFIREIKNSPACFMTDVYEAFPAVAGFHSWIESTTQLLSQDKEIDNPNDFVIVVTS
ncbi:hypothetical protein QAD02_006795 [Eretmocerus hayati]|uniref:Uncharacterized protein n=1 Tax=Eretmocerus hayati TaxID=131215 RepID=A0ACC2N314_9HYME|nr:hypothetical protein QAD02_006795 [Eretmocerus hayati]